MHEQFVDQRGRVVQGETARRVGKPARQEAARRGGEPRIGDAIEACAHRARNIGRKMDAHGRRFDLRALGLGSAIEIKLGCAVGRDQRDAVAFENAEIGAIAQVIALPGIAVKHEVIDAGLPHRRSEPLPPLLAEFLVHVFAPSVPPRSAPANAVTSLRQSARPWSAP